MEIPLFLALVGFGAIVVLCVALALFCFVLYWMSRALVLGIAGLREEGTIPRGEKERLEATIQLARQLAERGNPLAGQEHLVAGLQRARRTCHESAAWWTPLITRWQESVEQYGVDHGLEPGGELVPASAPEGRGTEPCSH